MVLQNASFTFVSRSRNSPSLKYHAFSIIVANNVYVIAGLFTLDNSLRILRTMDWKLILATLIFITCCNLLGGLSSQSLAIRVERWLGVESNKNAKTTE